MLTPFSLRHKLHAQSRAALSSWVLSKFPNSRHSELIKWTNSFIAKRQPWKRKNVLFMIDYKITVLTLLGEGNQRIQLACEKHATISWMTGEQELFIWFLKLLKPDVEDGIKLTRNDSLAAREPIVNRTRNTLEITEDNTTKKNREPINKYWKCYYAQNEEQIKDFVTKGKENLNSRRVSPTVSSLNFPMTFLLVLE